MRHLKSVPTDREADLPRARKELILSALGLSAGGFVGFIVGQTAAAGWWTTLLVYWGFSYGPGFRIMERAVYRHRLEDSLIGVVLLFGFAAIIGPFCAPAYLAQRASRYLSASRSAAKASDDHGPREFARP